jgi:ABC-type transport system substrate-binding protein
MVLSRLSRVILALPSLLLLLALACGTAAEPTPTQAPATGDTAEPTATSVPLTEPTATPASPQSAEPAGTINMGHTELSRFTAHPSITGNPQLFVISTAITEGLVSFDENLEAQPMLAESWEISDDATTWTFNIRPGVQFHKGYGEMTADDVLYSYRQWGESGIHARGGFIDDFFNPAEGSVEITDPHTLVVNAGKPWVDVRVLEFIRNVGGSSAYVVSQQQSEELGVEEASVDIAGTGPWEIVEHTTGEMWRMQAVEDHWRQTPYFSELIFWEIPEESSRIAGFQTGNLDTFIMAFDSIPLVEEVQGAKLMSAGLIGQAGLNLYGQVYPGGDMPETNPGYAPDMAWVSSNPDPESEEWQRAAMVREALAISIDRQSIVDTLLQGFGSPLHQRDWAGHANRADPSWTREFDPDRAMQLLDEAGYPDGFSITLTPAIRNAPSEVEACEAIANMWTSIGIDVELQRIPYGTLRPSIVARTYHGATCHTISVRLDPILGLQNYVAESVFSYGTEHPWMEEHIPLALAETDPERREELLHEVHQFFYDNAIAGIGLYTIEGVWPVGPRIEEWELTSYSDIRTHNGYEHIRPRQ